MLPLHKGSAFPMDGFIRARRHQVVQRGVTSYTSLRRNQDTTNAPKQHTVSRKVRYDVLLRHHCGQYRYSSYHQPQALTSLP